MNNNLLAYVVLAIFLTICICLIIKAFNIKAEDPEELTRTDQDGVEYNRD